MSQEFLKSSELQLNPAGYLVSAVSNKPVRHFQFSVEQAKAEYIVKLTDAIKGKVFTSSKVDSLDAIKKEVINSINSTSKRSYVAAPIKPINDINDQLVKFALDFADFKDEEVKTKRINEFMQQFYSISDVEEVGEYFSEGLLKLNKIYTIAEILEAVKESINVLG